MGPARVHSYDKGGEYMKSCFLFGHRDTPQDITSDIEAAVERQYRNHGIRQYYVGSYGSFDSMAASAVKKVKKQHKDIILFLLLPYHPAERPVEIPEGFDGSFYPPLENVPRRYAIVRANRYMIETCDSIICYVNHIGNTRKLLEYARRRAQKGEMLIENLVETN